MLKNNHYELVPVKDVKAENIELGSKNNDSK
jgi:hypothetical protein